MEVRRNSCKSILSISDTTNIDNSSIHRDKTKAHWRGVQSALIRSGQSGDGVVSSLNFTTLTYPMVGSSPEVEEAELIFIPSNVETSDTKLMSMFTDINWDHLSTCTTIQRITMDSVSNRVLQLAAAILNTDGSRLTHFGMNALYDDPNATLEVIDSPTWISLDMCKNVWEKLTSIAFPLYVLESMAKVVFTNVTSLRIIFSSHSYDSNKTDNLHVQFPNLQHLEIDHFTSGPHDRHVSLLDAMQFQKLSSVTMNIGHKYYRSGYKISIMRRFKQAYQAYSTLTAVREEIQELAQAYHQLAKKGVVTADDINALIGEAQMILPCDPLAPYYPFTV